MYVCYLDEAGCTGALPSATHQIQPAFILLAMALPLDSVPRLTTDFLRLKREFFPHCVQSSRTFLDSIRYEIKGAELRKAIALGTPREHRHAIGFLDRILNLLEYYEARVFGRVWIKGIGATFDGTSVYTSSVQDICQTFQSLLVTLGTGGIVIADSRNKPKNSSVSHSIFTQKYRLAGDPFDRIIEMPTFGHSDNHAGLQMADLLCSALLFPMAMFCYCTGHIQNLHVRAGYEAIHERYCISIKKLQHRYQEPEGGRWRGGLTVCDGIARRPGSLLFQ